MKIKNVFSICFNIIFYVLLILIIGICIVMGKSKIEGKQPVVLGYKFYIVLTGSMQPNISPGDLIMDKVVDTDEIEIGDAITFNNKNAKGVTTHRVQDVIEDGNKFVTKGDANNIADMQPVSKDDIQGKVVKVFHGIGSKIQLLQDNMMTIFIVLVSFVVILTIVCILRKPKKVS